MIAEIGHLALILAFGVAIVQIVVPVSGAVLRWGAWMRMGRPLAVVQFALTSIAYLALTIAFLRSDFSVALVANNSHTAKPFIYKLSGVWGNHEGSMLLWILILNLYGTLVAVFGRNLPPALKANVLSAQAAISASFTAFVLFTSNPFARMSFPPFDGQDLNPLLQDPGLAFHPPFLYLGYVGLSIPFCFALAALIGGEVNAAFARWVRPWVLASWLFLTLGIAMGSWWAYYELGWGGWWFWDPVENASFMPWLFATALLHSALVAEKRDCLKSWTVLLAILSFSFSLLGTFLVRSGIITSVHAFASDPTRGVFILCILAVFAGGALILFAVRARDLNATGAFAIVSRESAIMLNNLLLVVAAFVVMIGTFWPLIVELFSSQQLSVGPPYFDVAFTPFMVGLALILPIGASLAWKRGSLKITGRYLLPPAALSVALASLVWMLQDGTRLLAPVGLALATWLIAGTLWELAKKIGLGRHKIQLSLRWIGRLPRADWGKALAHIGLGFSILGIAAVTAWEIEDIRIVHPGESFSLGVYEIRFDGVEDMVGPNYRSTQATLTLIRGGRRLAELTPELRYYPVANRQTTEAAIDMGLLRDVYVVIGDSHENGGRTIRSYIKPMANWIWIGALTMSLGGALSLSDRRYRIAARSRISRAKMLGAS